MKSATKSSQKYECTHCDFICCKQSEWNRHILTRKHKNRTNVEHLEQNLAPFAPHQKYICNNCNKSYNARNSLWYHKKSCTVSQITEEETTNPSNDMFILLLNQNMELIKQNNEFKNLLAEQNKNMIEIAGKIGGNTTNSNNTTNNNFNLQFFLNEQCKDALNIEDFVKQIKLQLSDLDMIGRVGYVAGMSKIIIRNLNELDVCKRPIHCSDLKRETLYVKDNNAWEKENGENVKLTKAIKGIECKNIKQIPQWVEENPTSEDTDTKKHMEYKNIVLQAMGGSMLEDDNKKQKLIIRNIAKEVVIDKTLNKNMA